MAYEYENDVISELEQMGVDYESNGYFNMSIEVQEVYRKAKAFDEVKGFIIRKLKEEEEEKPRTLLSDYDYGLYQSYDNVDDIIQEYLERD